MYRICFLLVCLCCAALTAMLLSVSARESRAQITPAGPQINADHSAEENKNINIALEMMQGFSSGDMDYFYRHLAADVTLDIQIDESLVPTGGRWAASDGVQRWLDTMAANWRSSNFQIDGLWADGNTVIIRGSETTFAPRTGKQFRNPWIMVMSFSGGVVRDVDMFSDGASEYWSLQP